MISHRIEMFLPNGSRKLISEHFPLAKLTERRRCKYCYATHNDWHLMDRSKYLDDRDKGRIILCGKCEHASRVDG